MKNNGKASRAMGYIDDGLIAAAMNDADLNGENAHIEKRRNTMKQTMWKKWVAVAAMFAVVISAVVVIGQFAGGAKSGAVIAFDVNPSIELEVNKDEKIVEVRALNSDAEAVLLGLELQDSDLKSAVNEIISSMVENDYLKIDQNSILISVNSKSAKTAKSLKNKLSADVNTLLGDSNIDAAVIVQSFDKNDEINKKAEENHISAAKAALISKIVAAGLLDANGVPYDFAVLAELRVHELKMILESKGFDIDEVVMSGIANLGDYKTKDEAINAALAAASLTSDVITRLEVELDFEDDIRAMVYEVEFVYNGYKYEYELNAKNLFVIESERKPYDKEDEDDNIKLPAGSIDRLAALEIAYENAKVNAENVKRPEIEIDREGSRYVYDIEFKFGGNEYEYVIDAANGEIIECEIEPID